MKTRHDLVKMKQENEKITMITAYDYPSAKHVQAAGADMILVGDSLGNVVLGYDSTVQVTLDDMLHHGKAARRGADDTFIVVDMPFMSYHVSLETSMANAGKLFQETNAQALKIEGGSKENIQLIERLTTAGIPVVGHLGLTPQTFNVLGGYRVQGKDTESARALIEECKQVAQAGAVALVLECVPMEIAEFITNEIDIPTIGIGAGIHCDGQVLVYHDILKYGVDRLPKFVKSYADLNDTGVEAVKNYVVDVKAGTFPTEEYSFLLPDTSILKEI